MFRYTRFEIFMVMKLAVWQIKYQNLLIILISQVSNFVFTDREVPGIVLFMYCRNVITLYQYFVMFVFRYVEDRHDTSD
jgi:hypothetical protein